MRVSQSIIQPGTVLQAAFIEGPLSHQAAGKLAALAAHRMKFENNLSRILQRQRYRSFGLVHAAEAKRSLGA